MVQQIFVTANSAKKSISFPLCPCAFVVQGFYVLVPVGKTSALLTYPQVTRSVLRSSSLTTRKTLKITLNTGKPAFSTSAYRTRMSKGWQKRLWPQVASVVWKNRGSIIPVKKPLLKTCDNQDYLGLSTSSTRLHTGVCLTPLLCKD